AAVASARSGGSRSGTSTGPRPKRSSMDSAPTRRWSDRPATGSTRCSRRSPDCSRTRTRSPCRSRPEPGSRGAASERVLGVVTLAAGRGSRLEPLSAGRPKCLVSLAGRTLLDWQRAALDALGARERTLVLGYGADAVAVRPDERAIVNRDWNDS